MLLLVFVSLVCGSECIVARNFAQAAFAKFADRFVRKGEFSNLANGLPGAEYWNSFVALALLADSGSLCRGKVDVVLTRSCLRL